jgi:hypothetical protein
MRTLKPKAEIYVLAFSENIGIRDKDMREVEIMEQPIEEGEHS